MCNFLSSLMNCLARRPSNKINMLHVEVMNKFSQKKKKKQSPRAYLTSFHPLSSLPGPFPTVARRGRVPIASNSSPEFYPPSVSVPRGLTYRNWEIICHALAVHAVVVLIFTTTRFTESEFCIRCFLRSRKRDWTKSRIWGCTGFARKCTCILYLA